MSGTPVGVVVVHYGDPGPTRHCVEAVAADPSRAKRRLVVVDNSAAAEPIDEDALSRAAGRMALEVLAAPDNPGFGAGANRGVERLRAIVDCQVLVVLNHDVEILPGYLDAAVRAACLPGVGAVAGPIRLDGPDGPLWYAGGRFRPLTGTVAQSRSEEDAVMERDVGFLPGAAIALRREAWSDVGGYDPAFFLYHEDLDLSLRLRRRGWRLRFDPAMAVIHNLGGATGSRRHSAVYLEEMAATRFQAHRSRIYRLYLAFLHTPYVLLRALKLTLSDRNRGAARARGLLRGHRRALRRLW